MSFTKSLATLALVIIVAFAMLYVTMIAIRPESAAFGGKLLIAAFTIFIAAFLIGMWSRDADARHWEERAKELGKLAGEAHASAADIDEALSMAWAELRAIRTAINAHPDEATIDEVRSMAHQFSATRNMLERCWEAVGGRETEPSLIAVRRFVAEARDDKARLDVLDMLALDGTVTFLAYADVVSIHVTADDVERVIYRSTDNESAREALDKYTASEAAKAAGEPA